MDISKLLFLTVCLFAALSCRRSGCCSEEKETMYQVATLQSLMAGNYDGYVSIGELKAHGDVGLGTFHRINGEMIVLDGCVFQALGDGSVVVADDSVVYTYGRNFIYALRLDINASSITFRSELPQEKPYGPLSEVLPGKQRTFSVENIGGTVVAVYFPSFFSGQNTPGWHFHFISCDRKQGGHLLEISSAETAVAQLDAAHSFNLYLPQDSTFNHRELSEDMSDAIEAVEHSER